jgi:hypothetical protein
MTQAILIKFGDNDFHNAFMHAMSQLHTREFIYGLSKEKISFIFSEVLFSSYLIAQNNLEYNGLENLDEKYILHIKDYLKISPEDIFVGESADSEFSKTHWQNGDWFYMNPYTFSSI